MAKQSKSAVTMRVRVGDSELEVSGPKEFVEEKIAEFLKNSRQTAASAHQHTTLPLPLADTIIRKMSLAQFFKKTNPRTDNDRVLLAAYFREKMQNAENSTAGEIRDIIRKAKRPPPKNTNDAINQNIKKGLLMTAGDRDNKIAVVVTTDGEEAIDEMLKPTT
jgi:predicted metal-dependent hydrolase